MKKGGLSLSETVIEEVKQLIEPILKERSLSLFDIEYVRQGKDNFLRVYIDKEGGVDLNECSIVSERLSEKLDEADPIEGAYFLEVSSPGAERPLKTEQDFKDNISKYVNVKLHVHIDGENEYEGVLTDFKDNVATIEYQHKHRMKEVEIPFDKIAKARLSVKL